MAETPSSVENSKEPESKDSIIMEAKKKMQSLLAEMGFKKGEKPAKPTASPEGPGRPLPTPPTGPETFIEKPTSNPGGTIGIGKLEGGTVSGSTSGTAGPEGFNRSPLPTPEGPGKPLDTTISSIPGGTIGNGNLDGGVNSGIVIGPTTPANFVGTVNPTNPFGR